MVRLSSPEPIIVKTTENGATMSAHKGTGRFLHPDAAGQFREQPPELTEGSLLL